MQTAQDKHALQEEYAIAGETIPIIDLGPFLAEEPGAAFTAASEMRDALERIGFFLLHRDQKAFGLLITASPNLSEIKWCQKLPAFTIFHLNRRWPSK